MCTFNWQRQISTPGNQPVSHWAFTADYDHTKITTVIECHNAILPAIRITTQLDMLRPILLGNTFDQRVPHFAALQSIRPYCFYG